MSKTLYLLDGMALVYRAHFAFIRRPIRTSRGMNTSALFGFAQTLLELRDTRQPSHLAVVLDTAAPTRRHREFPDYKAKREAMPEDLSQALPHLRRLVEAFRVPVLALDGYEADDLIGTLVRRAEADGFESFMVTPDKDLGQLVTERTFLYRPGRMGGEPEVLGPAQIRERWGIRDSRQVIDILGLMGDASDNIPGVPGIGEKTASRLIAEYGGLDDLLRRVAELKGKLRETLEAHGELARLSRHLATIDCDVPLHVEWSDLKVRDPDCAALQALLVEFEFNALGRRLFGEQFKAGRGFDPAGGQEGALAVSELGSVVAEGTRGVEDAASGRPALRTLAEVRHRYRVVRTAAERQALRNQLESRPRFGLAVGWTGTEPRRAELTGVALSGRPHEGWWLPVPREQGGREAWRNELKALLGGEVGEKVGHDLKADLGVLAGAGVTVGGRLFDVMLAHALVDPDLRHTFEYIAESRLGYTPAGRGAETGSQGELGLDFPDAGREAEAAIERADLALQLREVLDRQLLEKAQQRVFHDIEMPLVPVLVELEREGIRIDASALAEFAEQLSREMAGQERAIHRLAGLEFNVNSPKQLGEVLFEKLRLAEAPKKTRTGQYATDEQTLLALAGEHEIVRRLLEYRTASKLKSTYADALPAAIDTRTGRVHTTFQQLLTSTGRLSSQNPNLQNIPIRTELGQEIRRAFVPRDDAYLLLSADYSQIELRIIAALSREAALVGAFRENADVHTATAVRVFGVPPANVTPEMRKQAKMVNYGIAYGISAFGLAQRLAIPRKEAAAIIDHYFAQFPGIRDYMEATIEGCRRRGYVETVTGRRRYLADIRSANATVRSAAERNAINAPIQGTAADMIKIAMAGIHGELRRRQLRTRMLLQVHDELVFDLFIPERDEVVALVEEKMRTAIPLDVPIVVEAGVGRNWLEAH